MAGHSQFANIKHRKGAQDAKKAKIFTKLLREVTVAAKSGNPDIEFNARLRNAVIAARGANMPKDRIEAAIKKVASGIDNENFEEIRYEGYGPFGVAVVVEALTDNRNRTASEVRSIFTKAGGSLGETNSVSFMFDKIGLIEFEGKVAGEEQMFEIALDAGASEVESVNDWHVVVTEVSDFAAVRDKLIAKFGDPQSAKITWRAKTFSTLNDEQLQAIEKMVDALEDCDDVQQVIANYN